jgi:integrase/recombinase XerC
VAASLYRFWYDTGYLAGNPAAGLAPGARARSGFTPKRFVPAPLLGACDAWVARSIAASSAPQLKDWRRAAIWTVYRYAGVRLSELAWNSARGLPRIDVDTQGDWTLHVVGKGDKERSIPLPRACGPILAGYRQAGGLAAAPSMLERLPLAHGEKGSALGARGLFDEVKHVLVAVAHDIKVEDPGGAALLRSASPHWLRHAYARRLVVDARVPLPAAQTLLGHASVQTTAEYAKTDLSKVREFVEQRFAGAAP